MGRTVSRERHVWIAWDRKGSRSDCRPAFALTGRRAWAALKGNIIIQEDKEVQGVAKQQGSKIVRPLKKNNRTRRKGAWIEDQACPTYPWTMRSSPMMYRS